MLDLLNTQRGYTPLVPKPRVSKDAQEPVWRTRIAAAVAPHGQLKTIADAADMESPQLQKIANGTTKDPGVATLTRISRAMGLTLEQLIAEPRPEKGSGHDTPGDGASGAIGFSDSVRRALAEFEKTGQFPNDWRGDIMLAIFTLTRALQRPAAAAESQRQIKEA